MLSAGRQMRLGGSYAEDLEPALEFHVRPAGGQRSAVSESMA